MKEREIQLWNYIDGILDKEEMLQVEAKLASDTTFYALYKEMLGVNDLLGRSVELDEPSMSFTSRVMVSVAAEVKPVPLKTKVSKTVVFIFSSVFALLLGGLIAVAFGSADDKVSQLALNFDESLLAKPVLYLFLLIDGVLLLIFFDFLLRKKVLQK